MRAYFLLFFFFSSLMADDGSWAEDILAKMTLQEKIGQLFMIPACPTRKDYHEEDLFRSLEKYHIGSILVKQSDPKEHMALVDLLQKKSVVPLFIARDAENGLSMTMRDVISYPKNLTLGAIQENECLYCLGREIGRQMKLIGTHINLSPVVDVNTNPLNPVIHMRSFGDDVEKVSQKAIAMIKGMQVEKILACAKHFPGHGDTTVDSHCDVPLLQHSLERLENLELYPFRQVINQGVDCIMTAHLVVPALIGSISMPASLSFVVVKDLLQKKMQFEGLVISDALNMRALSLYFSDEDIALLAYAAGHDILLYGDHISANVDRILQVNLPKAFAALENAFLEGRFSQTELDLRVLRILRAKEKLQLNNLHSLCYTEEIAEQLHSDAAYALKKELYQQAITFLLDKPFISSTAKIAYIRVGSIETDNFLQRLSGAFLIDSFSYSDLGSKDFSAYDYVIISLFDVRPSKKDYGLDVSVIQKIESLNPQNTIIALFGTPYALRFFEKEHKMLIAYEEDVDAQIAAAEVIMGKREAKGRLPVSIKKEPTLSLVP